jgi:hypothetical protein
MSAPGPDLATAREIDLASVQLSFEGFRQLAVNPHLSLHERIGFPDQYRSTHERAIVDDICRKLPQLVRDRQTIVDIGPGCANLPRMVLSLCARHGHRAFMVDSAEMLDQLPDQPELVKLVGAFPRIAAALPIGQADAVLCYSVLQYMFVEDNVFAVLDAALALLAPGGRLLFGDIPNHSKRKRFFASAAGREHHRAFTGQDTEPAVRFNQLEQGRIDDAVLSAMMARAQLAGFDAYLLPQDEALPMANRRDDLLFQRP